MLDIVVHLLGFKVLGLGTFTITFALHNSWNFPTSYEGGGKSNLYWGAKVQRSPVSLK